MQSAPRGAFCVAILPGSTAEARGREVLGSKAKIINKQKRLAMVVAPISFNDRVVSGSLLPIDAVEMVLDSDHPSAQRER